MKKQVSPQFPEAARQLEQEGACTLRFFIDEKGHPTRVEVERCPTVFRDAALEAAWKWTFYPMKEQGRPVPATFALTFRFQLSD